ncbi:thioredoxin domain-containing protein 5 homolog [Cephus cinctus]|uniref:Thioredoxin domain-containing protein 5 homolog n=1 Tax=Cephus cinctus TaxID=211228 RepID=A0AAJ7BN96_CEPCN|nr:thioredoxin domain-containing protein 5 homolog [Cephus cinctus]
MIRKSVYLLFLVPAQIAFAQEEDARIVQYNTEEPFLEGHAPHHHFTMYYNSKLDQDIQPFWKHLRETYDKYKHDHMRIVKIDCATHESICIRENITHFPTFKLFIDGERKRITFHGKEDIPTLIAFIEDQLIKAARMGDK